jgi:hypothetical protein
LVVEVVVKLTKVLEVVLVVIKHLSQVVKNYI